MLSRRVVGPRALFGVIAMLAASCANPTVSDLRDSFAQQLAANKYVKGFNRTGDDLNFTGPGADGSTAKWRVHIDSAVIEPTKDAAKPYKGTVKSSWYADGYNVKPDLRESNLPLELISTGLAQDCWAAWNKTTKKWEWE